MICHIRSQFTIKGYLLFATVVLLLFLSGCFSLLVYHFFVEYDGLTRILLQATIITFVIFLIYCAYLTLRQLLIITVTESYIQYRLPLLPIIEWKRNFEYYDQMVKVTVFNNKTVTKHPAVWLVRNGKVKMEIYQYIYKNYDELINGINLPCTRLKHNEMVDSITYVAYMLGVRKIKTIKMKK